MEFKVLHITNWYPSKHSPKKALWIQNQIKSLSAYVENKVVHIEVIKGNLNIRTGKNNDQSVYYIIHFPFEVWKIFEILSFCVLLVVFFKYRKSKFEVINFHIAYPNCTYIHKIRSFINKPILINEHWSGYHYNFNISNPLKRKRIQEIFHHKIPVITVSKALARDIQSFSEAEFPQYVVPNIVNTRIFKFKKENLATKEMNFFMVSQWKWPKDPFTVIHAWEKVVSQYSRVILKIGGYGPQWNDIIALIKELGLESNIVLLGIMNQEEIAVEMKKSMGFIHCSEYETFSVVCAEALCCGTPVIASQVGGIPEFINSENGMLIKNNIPDAFADAILMSIEKKHNYDRRIIAEKASEKFSKKNIGMEYYRILNEIKSNWN